MHRNSRLVVQVIFGVLGVALLAGVGVGIAALCGAFNQKPKNLCGRLKVAGQYHTFLVPADRTGFVSLAPGGAVDLWTSEKGAGYKSSEGLQVEVKRNQVKVKTANVVMEMYPACEQTILDISIASFERGLKSTDAPSQNTDVIDTTTNEITTTNQSTDESVNETGKVSKCGEGFQADKASGRCVSCADLLTVPQRGGEGCESCQAGKYFDPLLGDCVSLAHNEAVSADGELIVCGLNEVPKYDRVGCRICQPPNEIVQSTDRLNNADSCLPCLASQGFADNACRVCLVNEEKWEGYCIVRPEIRQYSDGKWAVCPRWARTPSSGCCDRGQSFQQASQTCRPCASGEKLVAGTCIQVVAPLANYQTGGARMELRSGLFSSDIFCGKDRLTSFKYSGQFVMIDEGKVKLYLDSTPPGSSQRIETEFTLNDLKNENALKLASVEDWGTLDIITSEDYVNEEDFTLETVVVIKVEMPSTHPSYDHIVFLSTRTCQ